VLRIGAPVLDPVEAEEVDVVLHLRAKSLAVRDVAAAQLPRRRVGDLRRILCMGEGVVCESDCQGRERRKGGRARLYTHGLEQVVDAGSVLDDRGRQLRSTACDAPFGIRVPRSAKYARAFFDRATVLFRIGKRHGTLATTD